jgi:hypothetical protein
MYRNSVCVRVCVILLLSCGVVPVLAQQTVDHVKAIPYGRGGKRALTFAEDDSALNSLVIVEFKKPDRSDYRKEDPVDQVYRLIREIKSGHFKDKNGREIKVQSELIPAYAYVICDTTKEVEIIAQNKGLLPTPDQLSYTIPTYRPTSRSFLIRSSSATPRSGTGFFSTSCTCPSRTDLTRRLAFR